MMRRRKSAYVVAWKIDMMLSSSMLVVDNSQFQLTAEAEIWLIIRIRAPLVVRVA